MEAEREERRKAMVERKQARVAEEQRNIAEGNPGDVDFIGMVRKWRAEHAHTARVHNAQEPPRICIAVRKRPVTTKEREKNDHDSITCLNPVVWIHSAKLRVDGITKYLDHASFVFDHSFDETESNETVYKHTTMPLLDFCVTGNGGRATVFAFGQTGSGKTHTMQGIEEILAADLFTVLKENEGTDGCSLNNTRIMISFFEIYGNIQDLLNERKRLKILEDGKGEICVTGLTESEVQSSAEFLDLIHAGNLARTTHTTEANDTSSRSHAICQIMLRDRKNDKLRGKLSLVDLAGSERGADTKQHNADRRGESAVINTSLLALKECIRALDTNKKGAKHVPYRSSTLTLILKDCFTSEKARMSMIATVSPGASSADHSLNTLRYADRTKEKGSKTLSPARKISPLSRPLGRNVTTTAANKSSASVRTTANTASNSPARDNTKGRESSTTGEDILRQTVTALLEQEEEILNTHMSNIQENADLLTREGELLAEVQRPDRTPSRVDQYATALEAILEQKEDMIIGLRKQMAEFKENCRKEQKLAKKVRSLS